MINDDHDFFIHPGVTLLEQGEGVYLTGNFISDEDRQALVAILEMEEDEHEHARRMRSA